jgi:simple sugar transport system permease protein
MSTVTPSSGTPAGAPTGGPAQTRRAPRRASVPLTLVRRFLTAREGSIVVVTVLLTVYFISTLSSAFTSSANIQALFPYFAPYAILAVGEVFLMINGEIDLSIGGVYLFAPYLYYELANGHVPLLPAVLISLAACTLIGLANGLITMVVGISSFITTLGTLFTLEGLTLIISHAEQVTAPGSQLAASATSNSLSTFASVFGAGTYSELIWALIIVAIMHVVLVRTRWGIHTIAVGSNRVAAAEAGVRVRLVVIRNFMVCSTFAGIVGILEAIRTSSITPDPSGAGTLTLSAIACAVIGGTLLIGGAGTVLGALVGALFLGILQDGLAIKGVNADYLDFYLGLAILLAMAINIYVGRVRRRSGYG